MGSDGAWSSAGMHHPCSWVGLRNSRSGGHPPSFPARRTAEASCCSFEPLQVYSPSRIWKQQRAGRKWVAETRAEQGAAGEISLRATSRGGDVPVRATGILLAHFVLRLLHLLLVFQGRQRTNVRIALQDPPSGLVRPDICLSGG